MIVTSDTTALIDIRIAASTGRPVFRNIASGAPGEAAAPRMRRPSTKNTTTGMAIVPNRPSGSRAKILISSQVSCQSPFISIPDGVAGQPEEHVLERRQRRVKVGDGDAMARDALDHVGHQPGVTAADGHRRPV